jgi:hypothetical protein
MLERRPIENIFRTDGEGNPTGGFSVGCGFSIAWQEGVSDRNGAFLEEVIAACVARFEYYQEGKFACPENAAAAAHLNGALEAMADRQRGRAERGVQGSYKP